MAWRVAYPNATISHYPITNSDHRPIVLSLFGSVEHVPKPFKFEAFWLSSVSCLDVVAGAWHSVSAVGHEYTLFKKIRATRFSLRSWNKKHFGNIHLELTRVKAARVFSKSSPYAL